MTARAASIARMLLVACLAGASSGCLVVSLHPAYDDQTIAWDPALIGAWQNTDDTSSIRIERGEWQSYRVHYVHPIETGDLTGYLTIIGNERYLDVMPARGRDPGSFLVPVHAVLRLRLSGDTLELTPLSYEWFFSRLRSGRPIVGLNTALDQKENALILSTAARLRNWLRTQAITAPSFGATATFTRKPAAPAPGVE